MNLAAVMDEIGVALAGIADLRVYPKLPGRVLPPAAVVTLPERITFDATYQRGVDTMDLRVLLLVGRPTEPASRDALAAYCDGAGARSVKAAVDGHPFTACDDVTVTGVDFDTLSWGGIDYLAALFDLTAAGSGN